MGWVASLGVDYVSCLLGLRPCSITFFGQVDSPGGRSKKATWAPLVANGPPISMSTCPFDAPGGFWADRSSWQLKRRFCLARWRRSRQPRLPFQISYSSEFCQQFKPPGQSTWANSTSTYRFEGGVLVEQRHNRRTATRPGRSILPIFNTFSQSRDLIRLQP